MLNEKWNLTMQKYSIITEDDSQCFLAHFLSVTHSFVVLFCNLSRLQYGIEAWGNSNSIHKLLRIQKRAIRVINNKEYRHHTDPLFKRNNIMKVTDLYQLQVFSFMHDLVNNKLPGSFDDFILITNESYYAITTRQCNRLYMTQPRPGLHFLRIYQTITL